MIIRQILLIIGVLVGSAISAALVVHYVPLDSIVGDLPVPSEIVSVPEKKEQSERQPTSSPVTNPSLGNMPAIPTENSSVLSPTLAPAKKEQVKPQVTNQPINQDVTSLSALPPADGLMWIDIPKIKIKTFVEPVGINSLGEMGVPGSPSGLVWFNLGPRPGAIGSAVMAGHSGWKNGIPAAFDNLHNLVPGDRLYVRDESGSIITFVVRKLQMYADDADATDVFSSSDGKAHLNLITCRGIWKKDAKSYTDRLVVFTDKE